MSNTELSWRALGTMVGQLVALRDGPDCDDYGRLRPTKHAFDETLRLLEGTRLHSLKEDSLISLGCVSTDSEGGVRIEWVRGGANVHLVVPATSSSEAYIYHGIGCIYATTDATPERLSYWLKVFAELEERLAEERKEFEK